MPNIAITNCCNLKCPYCFADDMIHEEQHFMSIKELKEILFFLTPEFQFQPHQSIGIIGGEPTLHPNFKGILNEIKLFCMNMHCGSQLFTNGIKLVDYIEDLENPLFSILINYNNPNQYNKQTHEKILNSFETLSQLHWFSFQKAKVGCNLFPTENNYSYFWKQVEKYCLPIVRVSVVSPSASFELWRTKKEEYFNFMKPIFLDFVKEAEKNHCTILLDCSRIPNCFFSQEELSLIQSNCCNFGNPICEPVIDFTVNKQATACFGNYLPINYDKFSTYAELKRYFNYSNAIKTISNFSLKQCETCEEKDLFKCQCGCLGFIK